MGDAPCGCELAASAEREEDDGRRGAYAQAASEHQAAWRCPAAGHAPPTDPRELGPAQRDACAAVARLTGCDAAALTTCPLALTRPAWVHRAVRAWRWAERGDLRSVEPAPSAALIDALDCIDRAHAARQAHDDARRKADQAASQARAQAAGPPLPSRR